MLMQWKLSWSKYLNPKSFQEIKITKKSVQRGLFQYFKWHLKYYVRTQIKPMLKGNHSYFKAKGNSIEEKPQKNDPTRIFWEKPQGKPL